MIMSVRKSQFSMEKDTYGSFDIMGDCFVKGDAYDLIGLFVLSNRKRTFKILDINLDRDDNLAIIKNTHE